MAKYRAGKKIKQAAQSFYSERSKRKRRRAKAWEKYQEQRTDRVKARQSGKSERVGYRQAGKVGKAQAIGQGGGYVGRQDMFGRVGEAGIKAGVAAVTGGASVAAEGLGGLLGDLWSMGDQSYAVSTDTDPNWRMQEITDMLKSPIVLGGIALAAVLYLNRKK